MSRSISSAMLSSLTSNGIIPAILAKIAFQSETVYVWTGVGSLSYAGNTYVGVGSFGKIGRVTEGTDLQAYGLTISLSGIDPTLLNECMTDVQLGAPVAVYFALLDQNASILGTPYTLFSGIVDKPTVKAGIDEITISLSLENRLANHQRASCRRYTAADQNLYYPGDTAFNWVEILNDQALRWTP